MNPDIYLAAYKFFGVLCGIFFCCLLRKKSDQGTWLTLMLLALYGIFVTGMHQMVEGWAVLAPFAFWIALVLLGGLLLIPVIACDLVHRKLVRRSVREAFPQIDQYHVERMIERVRHGDDLDAMLWDGENVVRDEGPNAEKLTCKGWRPLVEPVKPYPYLKEKDLVCGFLSPYAVEVSTESNHALCSLLYFNWNFEKAVLEGDSLIISMSRRDEARTDRYGCMQLAEANPAST